MIACNHTRALRCAALLLCVILAACGGGASDSSVPDGKQDAPFGSLGFVAPPSSVFVVQGQSATVTVTITRDHNTDPVTLTASGLPAGVTVAFNPGVLTGSNLSSTITLTAATDATAPASGTPTVTATGSHGISAEIQFPVTVTRPQVNVTRAGSGTGTVTSAPGGINCGSTCGSGFAYGTSVTLTAAPAAGSAFGGWSGTACSGTTTTCTFTITVTTNVTATFNSPTQGFSFAIAPTTASVPQGASAAANVSITRTNGYAGAVTLTISGAPSGLTIAANPTSITGNTATLNLAAASSVAAGNYPVTISATGAGISGAQTTTLHVQVTAAPGGSANVAFNFAACAPTSVPTWFANQSGTGPWARVTAGPNNTFTFAAGTVGAVAWVQPDGSGFATTIVYGSRNDITAIALGSLCEGLTSPATGTKTLMGSISNVVSTGVVTVALGGASVQVPGSGPPSPYPLDGVPDGIRDLIAAVAVVNPNAAAQFPKLILRRNVNYSGTIPLLDFNTEFVAPTVRPITTVNRGTDETSSSASLLTANGLSAEYYNLPANPNGTVSFAGVPDANLQPDDLHLISIFAAPTNLASFRLGILSHHSVVVDTVTFGPAISQPTVTSTGTSPYLRLRAQFASQTEYNTAANAEFTQSANSVAVTTMADYSSVMPATWAVEIPDLTSAGYDPTWGLKSGSPVDWEVLAAGGNILPLLGATPLDGIRMVGAGAGNTSSAFQRFRRSRRW